MSPKYILFGGAENLGGGFACYEVPAADEFIATGTSGVQTINTGTQQLYDADGSGDIVGGDLKDVQDGYIFFAWLQLQTTFTGGDPNNFIVANIREGATASTVDGGGAVGSEHQRIDFDASGSICGTWINSSRPNVPDDSEFGYHLNCFVGARTFVRNASLMVVGHGEGFDFAGSTLGARDNTWDIAFATTHLFNDQTVGDETLEKTAPFTVGHKGTYLCICTSRQISGVFVSPLNLRWNYEIDDVPLTNVRTDTATPGAVRTGRGFQYQHLFSPSKTHLIVHQTLRIVQLDPGEHEFKVRLNRHEGDGSITSQMQRLQGNVFNTNIFSQFFSKERNTVIELTGTTLVSVPEWSIDIVTDGTAKVWVGLGTDSHGGPGANARYSIFRNGVELIDSGTGVFGEYPAESGDGNTDMTISTRDSDNVTVPVNIFWYDDPPKGTHRYTVKASCNEGGGVTAFGNANDNGEDGFVGTFFVAELKLATKGF
jgi:hypothetical protein